MRCWAAAPRLLGSARFSSASSGSSPPSPPASPLFPRDAGELPLHDGDIRRRRRVLILCTGGTLTMAPSADMGGGLAPVPGALTRWVNEDLEELQHPSMPEVVVHEYDPLMDSSDMGPEQWTRLALDISRNYLHFDGFVVATGTDTMAYAASALAFMLENLGKPVILTGSQIPLSQPFNDARRNFLMAVIFASRDTICEVAIFFNDQLLRGCRTTKLNTHHLAAFDSPNLPPLARVGVAIEEASWLTLPQARGALRVHRGMDTRLLVMRLVPGFDDAVLRAAFTSAEGSGLRALVLQLYGMGNLPSGKRSLLSTLAEATDRGILVVVTTQCLTGSVVLGKYAVGRELEALGVISAGDMTLEATAAKLAYLFGRGDLNASEVGRLLPVPLRGEVTPGAAYARTSAEAGMVHSDAVFAALAKASG